MQRKSAVGEMIIYRHGEITGRFADRNVGEDYAMPKTCNIAEISSRPLLDACDITAIILQHNNIMSTTCQFAIRRFALSARSSGVSAACKSSASYLQSRQTLSRRWQSTEAASSNPKISTIVDQISQLTLLETADLVSTLKVG